MMNIYLLGLRLYLLFWTNDDEYIPVGPTIVSSFWTNDDEYIPVGPTIVSFILDQ